MFEFNSVWGLCAWVSAASWDAILSSIGIVADTFALSWATIWRSALVMEPDRCDWDRRSSEDGDGVDLGRWWCVRWDSSTAQAALVKKAVVKFGGASAGDGHCCIALSFLPSLVLLITLGRHDQRGTAR